MGADATHTSWILYEVAAERLGGSRWDYAQLVGILCAVFGKKNHRVGSGHGAMTLNLVQPPTDFSTKPRFQRLNLFPLTWRGNYAWFRSEAKDLPLALNFDLSKVIRGRRSWLTPHLGMQAKLAVFRVSWGPVTENVTHFSHRHVLGARLHYPMSIMAIGPVWPQAIIPTRLTMFPSRML